MRLTPQQIQEITDRQIAYFLWRITDGSIESELKSKLRFPDQALDFNEKLFEGIQDNPFLFSLGKPLIWSIVMSSFRSHLGLWFETLAKELASKAGFEVVRAYHRTQVDKYKYDLVLKRSTSMGEHYYLFEMKTSDERIDNKDAQIIKEQLLKKQTILADQENIPLDNVHFYFSVIYRRKKLEGSSAIRKYFDSDKIMSGTQFWSFICGAINEQEAVSENYFSTQADAYDQILTAYRRKLPVQLDEIVDKWFSRLSQQITYTPITIPLQSPQTAHSRGQATSQPEANHVPAIPQKRDFFRRTILMGLTGLAIGSILGWFAGSHSFFVPTSSVPTSSTPTSYLGKTLYTYRGHSYNVSSITWSPDGRRIASGSEDHTVQVWDATDGGNSFTYLGHSSFVYAVAWSPDGKRIASSDDSTVQVWNANGGGNAFTYQEDFGHIYVYAVAWSPDGKRIASGTGSFYHLSSPIDLVQVWNAADGGNVFTYYGHSSTFVYAVAWSPDGKRIASGGEDETVQVWDATDGGNVFIYRGHVGGVLSVVWSPDGKRIASGGYKTVQVWDATDGGNAFIYHGHSDYVQSVAWSPDGSRIVSGSRDGTAQVWDAADGSNIYTYRGHSGSVNAVAWSPDGKRIASGGEDKTVQVWDAEHI